MAGSSSRTSFALVAFADREAELWGIALDGAIAVGGWTEMGRTAPAAIEPASPDDPWRLSSAGTQLSVSPLGQPAPHAHAESFAQPCRVEGHVLGEEAEHPVSCLGIRAGHPWLDGSVDSLRAAYAWFSAEDALALSAWRPRGAKGHDRDAVSATVFENGDALAVGDPRLSTTYGEDGALLRTGLELWLGGEDGAVEYPRRATAEALGGAAAFGLDGWEASAYALRWRSRGQTGDGVYVLVRAA